MLPRGEPVEARVGAVIVVFLAPCRDQMTGMAQVGKEVLVQALVPLAAVEAFDEAVLHPLPGRRLRSNLPRGGFPGGM